MDQPRTTTWSLYERADSPHYWAHRTVRGRRERKSTEHSDKKLAIIVVEQWNREAVDPVYAAAKATTVGEAVARFLDEVAQRVRPATVEAYTGQCGHLVRVLGKDTPLAAVVADRVDAYTKQRTDEFVCAVHARGNNKEPCNRRQPCGEGAHPHTVKKELNCLRGTLHLARRRGEYALDPGAVLPKWKAHYTPRTTVHTLEQAWRVLRAIEDPERRGAIAYFYGTGARRSEQERARPREHVRLDAGEVFVDGTKTKRSRRTIPITPVMKPFLEVALQGLPQGQDQFRPWTNIRRDLLAACRRAGVTNVSLNDLRRSFATWHLEAGVPPELVARYLGHASTEMVDRIYGQPSNDSLKTLTEKHFNGATTKAPPPPNAEGAEGAQVIPITQAKRRRR